MYWCGWYFVAKNQRVNVEEAIFILIFLISVSARKKKLMVSLSIIIAIGLFGYILVKSIFKNSV